jgi:hypothetical protein
MAVETFAAVSDYHGDRHDPVARAAFVTFVEEFRPQQKWLLGDLWDFRALRVGADRDEKMASMKLDFEQGMEFLDWYRPSVFLLGNHDQRLWDAVEKEGLRKSGPLPDYAGELIERFTKFADRTKMLVLPYDKRKGVWSYKGIKAVHGFDGLNAKNMASIYGNVLFGHGHYILQGAAPHEEAKVARMIGCLCDRDMTYNRGQTKTLAQQHGFAYGVIERANRFGIMQAEIMDGQFSYAEKIKTVRAA